MEKYKNKYRIASARAQWWNYGWCAAYFITVCTQNREHYFGDIINGEMILSEIGDITQSEWFKTFEMRPDMNLYRGEFMIMPNHFHAIIGIGDNAYNRQSDGGNGIQFGEECDGRDGERNGGLNGGWNHESNGERNCGLNGGRDGERDGGWNHESNGGSNGGSNRRDAMHCVSTITNPIKNPIKNPTQISTQIPSPPSPPIPNSPQNQFGPQSKNLASIVRGFKIGVTKNARKIDINFGWQTRFHDHIIRNDTEYQRIATYINNNPANWQHDKFYST